MMKKLISFLLALCLSVAAAAAFAEDGTGNYLDSCPEAAPYVSAWVAEDGDWRIESFAEDDGIRLMVVHNLGDNKRDLWEYAAAMSENGTLTTVPLGCTTGRILSRTTPTTIMRTAMPNSASTKKANLSGRI